MGRFLAIGAIEPQFFVAMMRGLGLDPGVWDQADRSQWPELTGVISDVVATQPRDHWASVFDETDACVAPVLTMSEARSHPHNQARGTFGWDPDQPMPGPRFSAMTAAVRAPEASTVDDVLEAWVHAR